MEGAALNPKWLPNVNDLRPVAECSSGVVGDKMARRLIAVEDTFHIQGRGLVPVPGIVPEGDERFRIGDPLLLKRPDGSEIRSQIGGIEIICCTPPRIERDVVILFKELTKEDVPIGTEIWSVDPDQPAVPL